METNLSELGRSKTTLQPDWPSLVKLLDTDLFERFAMCWARKYLPLDQAPYTETVTKLRQHIGTYESAELWDEAVQALKSHLRACVFRAIHQHLPSDYQIEALADLEREDFGVLGL